MLHCGIFLIWRREVGIISINLVQSLHKPRTAALGVRFKLAIWPKHAAVERGPEPVTLASRQR
jgi:hypothetical protein